MNEVIIRPDKVVGARERYISKSIYPINIRPKTNPRSRCLFSRCFRVPAQGSGNMVATYRKLHSSVY